MTGPGTAVAPGFAGRCGRVRPCRGPCAECRYPEANGLLRRERRAEDERSVAIRLTEAGAGLRGRARTVPLAIGDAMGLTSEQDAMAKQVVRLITTNVTEG